MILGQGNQGNILKNIRLALILKKVNIIGSSQYDIKLTVLEI